DLGLAGEDRHVLPQRSLFDGRFQPLRDLIPCRIEWKRLPQNTLVYGDDVKAMACLDELGQDAACAKPEQHSFKLRYGFASTDLPEIAAVLSRRAIGQFARHAGEPVRLGQKFR